MRPDYSKSVFITCPFDNEYIPLFNAIVFTVGDCGLIVRCAKENADSSQVRIHKIINQISDCRLGIHDLSRTELDTASALPRFNMPLELGLFLEAKNYGIANQQEKQCLIFDIEPHRYQKYISDVSGQDIVPHGNDPRQALYRVREWLTIVITWPIPGPGILWERYERFNIELPEQCRQHYQKPEELTFIEYLKYIDEFRESREDLLSIGAKRRIINPSPQRISMELHELKGGENSFAIFEKSGSGLTYIQTTGDPHDGFILEYQVGSIENHYHCLDEHLPIERITEAFISYSISDPNWLNIFEWKKVEW